VPGITIRFTAGDTQLTLQSGANGTYGLIPVTADDWQVQVQPDPVQWLVTSTNPLDVKVTTGTGATQTGVDFCLQRISGPELTSLPSSAFIAMSSSTNQDPADLLSTLENLDPIKVQSIVSEALLTNPPPPQPPENIEDTLDTPVDEAAVPVAAWLSYLNRFREIGGLSPLTESGDLTYGGQWHSRYMVVNDVPVAHREVRNNPLYDVAGDRAARNSNIFATTQIEANHIWATNFWVSAPFHLTPMIDPGLHDVGYGQYNENVGTFKMAAVLDTRSDLGQVPDGVTYPLFFPGDGQSTWVVRHSLFEWPDPILSCPGYSRPSGPALVLQLGEGDITPKVSSHAVYEDDKLIESCRFDETNYSNPDPYAQSVGREILNERDAVVIMPRRPLAVGKTYRVEVTANGQFYTWQFTTQSAP